jgi:hypothetical protein
MNATATHDTNAVKMSGHELMYFRNSRSVGKKQVKTWSEINASKKRKLDIGLFLRRMMNTCFTRRLLELSV